MAITLTDVAVDRARKFIARRAGATLGLRLAVRASGCSVLSYAVEFAEKAEPVTLSSRIMACGFWSTRKVSSISMALGSIMRGWA